jgi:threonine dehydrogenase-like Zn-dependent dehydrogenase
MTSGRGVDTAIEAVGVPATFVLCEDIVAPGGTIASNYGAAVEARKTKMPRSGNRPSVDLGRRP